MSDIGNYLKMVAEMAPEREGWTYASYEELVLDYGDLRTEARLERSGPIKECYRNAWYAAEKNGWTYVEGYADSIIPVAHAWCLDDAGVVVETTWHSLGTEYYGIPLDQDWGIEVLAETGHYGILASDWMRKAVLLREGLPTKALKGVQYERAN